MHPDLWAKSGGGVDVPWVVFISQKMPQMPEAGAGVRRSPCAAVTNLAPALLPHSPTFFYYKREPEAVPGKGTRDRGPGLQTCELKLWAQRLRVCLAQARPSTSGKTRNKTQQTKSSAKCKVDSGLKMV